MTRADRIAFVLSLLGVLAAALVTERIFEGVPHIEDEIAYVWQANVLARGQYAIPSPDYPKSFLVPFVVEHEGQRFGKYPLGWSALLSIGVRLGIRHWVNPLLAGLGVWLTYCLGKRLFSPTTGLVAAGLMVTSPFFLMNSGSLLSHPFGMVLAAAFALAWLQAFGDDPPSPRPFYVLLGALALGVLALTRPFTAVTAGLPFALHGLVLFWRGSRQVRLSLFLMAVGVLGIAGLHFAWQAVATGDPWLNPYTLWWSYDKVGFGPGHGHLEAGHTLRQAYINTKYSLQTGAYDLFGWGAYSWIFLPFGLWAARRDRNALLVGSVFPLLVLLYMAYWIGSYLFGPRYFYESLFSPVVFSAAGIVLLAGWPLRAGETWERRSSWGKARPLLATAGLAALVLFNLVVYTPIRLQGMHNLYGIGRANLQPFHNPQIEQYTPALVIVHSRRWMGYGALLELQDPWLTTPLIFAWSHDPKTDAALADLFPERAFYHYYLDQPYVFYTAPRPEE